MKLFLAITFFLFCLTVSSKEYYFGTIYFNNGTEKIGLIEPPSKGVQKKLNFKEDENSKKIVFQSKNIKRIIVHINNVPREFAYCELGKYNKKGTKLKTLKDKIWMLNITNYFSKLDVYQYGVGFAITKKGEILIKRYDFFYFTIKKSESDLAIYVNSGFFTLDSYHIRLKEACKSYLKEDTELVEKINSGELNTLGEIVEFYNRD